MRVSILLAITFATFVRTIPAAAQTRFSEAAERAHEVDVNSFADEVGVLLTDCTGAATPAAKRSCVQGRRRAGRNLLRQTYLLELPGEGRIHFGSYEPSSGGFRVAIGGFVSTRAAGNGVLATAATTNGRLPDTSAAEGFVVVPFIEAARYLETHEPRDLTVRYVVRLGNDFEDATAAEASRRYGIGVTIVGVQVYADASGEVLVDTFARPAPLPLSRLAERTRMWSHTVRSEGLFVSPRGTEAVLGVRLEPREPGDTSITAVLMQTVGVSSVEILRVEAPCCSSSIDLERHGDSKVLAIITEQSSEEGAVGRGRVVLLAWDESVRMFESRAEWVGSNQSSPPAWVVDPSVDP